MSECIGFALIEKECLLYLDNNKNNLNAFLSGNEPSQNIGLFGRLLGKKSEQEIPGSWPTRNVETVILSGYANYWSYIFTGSLNKVNVPLSFLSETFEQGDPSNYDYGEVESFGMINENARILLAHLDTLENVTVEIRVKEYFENEGQEAFESDVEQALEEIGEFKVYISKIATSNSLGLLWYRS